MLATSAGPSCLPPAVQGSGRAVQRSQDPVPSTERGFAEPGLNSAGLCLQQPGTGSVRLAASAQLLLPSQAPALTSGSVVGFSSLWIMNAILSKIAEGDKQINM